MGPDDRLRHPAVAAGGRGAAHRDPGPVDGDALVGLFGDDEDAGGLRRAGDVGEPGGVVGGEVVEGGGDFVVGGVPGDAAGFELAVELGEGEIGLCLPGAAEGGEDAGNAERVFHGGPS